METYTGEKSGQVHVENHTGEKLKPLDTHTGEKSHKCEYCEREFKNIYGLKGHIARQHPIPEDMKYKCDHCDKTFAMEYFCKIHMKIQSTEKRFKCHKCDGAFKTNAQLQNHILFKHRYDEDVQKQYWQQE